MAKTLQPGKDIKGQTHQRIVKPGLLTRQAFRELNEPYMFEETNTHVTVERK